jgi:hypothetical protein
MGVAIDRATTMPSQGIQFQASNGGVAYNDPQEVVLLDGMGVEPSIEKVNHYECQVVNIDGLWKLKVARSGNIWRPMNSDCNSQYRTENITVGPLLVLTTGIDPLSPWASNNGYVTLDGATLFVYAYQVETADDCNFYIYVSLDAGLDALCPVTLPDEIEAPTVAYTVQVIRIADIVYGIDQWIVSQFVLGSITWPQTFDGGAAAEYVNQFELAIKDVLIVNEEGQEELVPALKVASGAHIYRPVKTDCDKMEYTTDLTADPTAPAVIIVPGVGSSRPWASQDGYVELSGGSIYVYAVKVETDDLAVFYIYLSRDASLADSCPVIIPVGIAAPTVDYTVQCLLIGSVSSSGGESTITQNIVGSITWPSTFESNIEQFQVRVTRSGLYSFVFVAKGRVLARCGEFVTATQSTPPPSFNYVKFEKQSLKEFNVKNFAVYESGTLYPGTNDGSVWASSGGYVLLPLETVKTYGVYLVINQFDASGYTSGAPYLAVIADTDENEALEKSRPYGDLSADYVEYYSATTYQNILIEISPGYPIPVAFRNSPGTLGGDNYNFTAAIKNYNCQRVKIATLVPLGGGAFDVTQHLVGTLTIPSQFNHMGIWEGLIEPNYLIGGYDWATNPFNSILFSSQNTAWNGAWAGYTKAFAGATEEIGL